MQPQLTPVQPPPPPPAAWTAENALQPASILPELRDDEPAQTLIDALDLSLQKYAAMDGTTVQRFGADTVPLTRIIDSLRDFRAKLAAMGLGQEFFSYLP